MKPRLRNAIAALALLSTQVSAQEQPLTTKCESAPLMAAFTVFSETGRMPPNMVKFIGDAALNKIEPYKAFDNVYYVGICWVSAWLITSRNGHVLIDTLYGPYTSQLLDNVRTLGFDPMPWPIPKILDEVRRHAAGLAEQGERMHERSRLAFRRYRLLLCRRLGR